MTAGAATYRAAWRLSGQHAAIAATFLALAILLGGGGTPNPLTELWLELLAVLAALAWLWLPAQASLRRPADAGLWLVAALALIVPLVQLMPLPPAVWTALPGRGAQLDALELIGAGGSWQPLSMSPARTLASLLALVPPLLMLVMVGALGAAERRRLIGLVAAMALLAALLGAAQLAGGEAAPRLYQASSALVVTGFQANRNSAADVFLIGIPALAVLAVSTSSSGKSGAPAMPRKHWLLSAAALVLALATVLTASRAGIALLPVALAGSWTILALDPARRWNRRIPAIAIGSAALLLAALVLLRDNTALRGVAARFGFTTDARVDLWTDSLFAIRQYWPFGSGMGTFVPSFIAAEPLEAVDPSLPNRAHNDFLELALESGILGLAALALAAAVLLVMVFRAWRSRPQDRPQIGFAITALTIVGCHSLVDYPLRSIALACLAALAAGILAAPCRWTQMEGRSLENHG